MCVWAIALTAQADRTTWPQSSNSFRKFIFLKTKLSIARSVFHSRAIDVLPIANRRAEIQGTIAANQVVIACGETGYGKTAQLPKICLELKRGIYGTIGCTQRRDQGLA